MEKSKTDAANPAAEPQAETLVASEPAPAVTSEVTSATEPTQTKSPTAAPTTQVTTPGAVDIDKSKPADFEGEVETTNELPSIKTIKGIEHCEVLDKHGKSQPFKSLYSGHGAAKRVLVIFIRHFFCGNCHEYIRTLAEHITPEALLKLPIETSIVVVGCGDPDLIDMYIEATKCPFPIYTDPTRSLFDKLGMMKTLAMGTKPAYMKKSMWRSSFDSALIALRHIPKGLALKSGDQRQVGGEFLFEPVDDEDGELAEKKVTWCHRMKSTRDHAEIPELKKLLDMTG